VYSVTRLAHTGERNEEERERKKKRKRREERTNGGQESESVGRKTSGHHVPKADEADGADHDAALQSNKMVRLPDALPRRNSPDVTVSPERWPTEAQTIRRRWRL
jgi:hypothetical protein